MQRNIGDNSDNGDFHCLGCLHSYRFDNKFKEHERLCNKHDYSEIIMPAEGKNIPRCNSREKPLKSANIFSLDLESLSINQ